MADSKKVCLITGATNGIGRAGARELAKQGWTMVLVGRDEARCRESVAEVKSASGNEDVSYLLADLSSMQSVRQLAEQFINHHSRLDVLINNAGAIYQQRGATTDGFERTFALNHLAYFLLTNLLVDVIKASAPARIVSVSSGAHHAGHIHFDDIHLAQRYSSFRAYGQSKLANVLFTTELARQLAGSSVTVNCLHPGFVASGFAHNNGLGARVFMALLSPFARKPQHGARTMVYLATSPEVDGVSGGYFADGRPARTSAEARDADVAKRLWKLSETLVEPWSAPLRQSRTQSA